MTTTVVGKESGTTIVVQEGVRHFSTGNSFCTLFVRGGPASGEVWLQDSIGKLVLPLPLPRFRNVKKVDKDKPKSLMWNGNNEYLDVFFTESHPVH
jgi:hypothetical protein